VGFLFTVDVERLDLPAAVAVGRKNSVPVTVTFDLVVPSLLAAVPLKVSSAAARVTLRLPSISAVTLTVVPFLLGVNVSNWSDAFFPSVRVSTFGSTCCLASSVKKSPIEPESPQPLGST